MKKRIAMTVMAAMMLVNAAGAMAEEHVAEKEKALAALKVSMPQAVVDYTVRDRDDGRLRYEGEAEIGGKRYEFEMSVDGSIIEWERD